MGSILKVIERQYEKQMKRKWYETYWMIDMHGVIIYPDHKDTMTPLKFYGFALDALTLLTDRPDIRMILYTCSHPKQIEYYTKRLDEVGIVFDYINVNPEIVTNIDYGCYDEKPYFDVYLDDKAGFDAESEWWGIYQFLREKNLPDENWKNSEKEKIREQYKNLNV